jgi:plasmid stabilization system protein ParE
MSARRALLRRFPYMLVFDVEEDRVTILGVFHGRRQPRDWTGRVTEPAVVTWGTG